MKRVVIQMIMLCAIVSSSCFFGYVAGYGIADYKALKSVCNSEQTDILELIIENDKHADVVSSYYDYKKGTGYLVLKDENIYTINVKVKKVAPFRYEWVEVVL